MPENQNIEWKESWRDEYIKWISGFANAQGGVLVIGKTDKGHTKGIDNAQKLLEQIPNKVRDILGIIVDVDLITENNIDYIEIKVEEYPFPVSYKGQYFYRSGSTKQELKGAALDKFLLKKLGKRWDGAPVPYIQASDLSWEAFRKFKSLAAKSKRIEFDTIGDDYDLLLDNLNLKEGKYYKRAAVLLFYDKPEKYVTGAYIKIGFFRTDSDLLYQDEIHGNLFDQAEKALDMLLTKYLRAMISYESLSRVESHPYPKAALREALLNAIVHKDYSNGIPIQISVYEDKIIFWNDGQLPENWTIDRLKDKHPSNPFNPDIANAFFRAGLIEAWGRGIQKIANECMKLGVPEPEYKYDFSGIMVTFNISSEFASEKSNEKASGKVIEEMSVKNPIKLIVSDYHEDYYAEKASEKKNDEVSEKIAEEMSEKKPKRAIAPVIIEDKTDEKTSEKKTEIASEKTSEKMLELINLNNKITISELSQKIGVSTRSIERNISKLQSNKRLERIGPDKGGYWKVL